MTLACVWMRGRRCATTEGSAPEAQGLEARQVGQDAAQGRAAFGRKPAEPAAVNVDVSDQAQSLGMPAKTWAGFVSGWQGRPGRTPEEGLRLVLQPSLHQEAGRRDTPGDQWSTLCQDRSEARFRRFRFLLRGRLDPPHLATATAPWSARAGLNPQNQLV